ncbi:MAG: hypothetical protein NVSMB2_01560 [Chloroflexota bacterium]
MSQARSQLNAASEAPVSGDRSDALSFQTLLDTARDGIIRLDSVGRITFINRTGAELIGLTSSEAIDRPIWTYIQFLDSLARADSGMQASLTVGGVTLLDHGLEVCCHEDGTQFPIEYEAAPLWSATQLHGAVVTFRDVSRRRATETMKDELIALTSHELRSPLTSIRSALGLLAGGPVGDMSTQARRLVQIAVGNTDRLLRLVNDLLDLERIDAGDILLHRVPCSMFDLMSQAADAMRMVADSAGVALEVLPSDSSAYADPDRILQVLVNLVANAIKFSPPQGGTIWLDVEHADGEIIVRVRDEGRGIPATKLEKIFDRFAQVDESDAREKGGSGLGLAISRSIVKQHGGQIWAESTVGVGTTLCVALPEAAFDSAAGAAA